MDILHSLGPTLRTFEVLLTNEDAEIWKNKSIQYSKEFEYETNGWNHQRFRRKRRRRDGLARAERKIMEIAGAFGLVGDAEKREGTDVSGGRSSIRHAFRRPFFPKRLPN